MPHFNMTVKKLFRTVVGVVALALVSSAQADIYTFTGNLTSSSATYNRSLADFSALSGVGSNVAYDVFEFTVDVSGEYTFLTTSDFDAFTFLYSPEFLVGSPTLNGVAANDDLVTFSTSGFAANLIAGEGYAFVNTTFSNFSYGGYSTTIGGPGAITAVPEPSSIGLLTLASAMLFVRRRFA